MSSTSSRRVVVTGIGTVNAVATNVQESWSRILAGETGIALDPDFGDQHKCQVRAAVTDDDVPQRFLSGKELRNSARFVRFGLEAAGEALIDAGLLDADLNLTADISAGGSILGNCVGGVYDDLLPVHETYVNNSGKVRISPHLHVTFPLNMASYNIQKRFHMNGPSATVATACATGSHAIGDGFHQVKFGRAPMMIGGGVESTRHPLFSLGFDAMKALCADSNDNPAGASRPFDATRAGFVVGEGAGMLVLEDLEFAQARGARILCEIVGYATSNDAYHPIAPEPDGSGAALAIVHALEDAGLDPGSVDHVNAHAASTPAGDVAEARAIIRVLGDRGREIPVTSVKGAIGHCMGGSGAIESVVAVKTIVDQRIPPTLNYHNPDPEIGLSVVATASDATIDVMTKHSFGLGGQNAALVFRRWDAARDG